MFIKLKKELFKSVLAKKKHATTRRGCKDINPGDAFFYDPENDSDRIAIKINKVMKVSWKSVKSNKFLFIDEGYQTKEDFHKALEKIYGSIDDTEFMTTVYFKLA